MVYATEKPIRMRNVIADPRTLLKEDPDIKKQKSILRVPLKAWGRVIGVLAVDNTTVYNAFSESDTGLLSTFADWAAIAIQNALLYAELDKLRMHINRGDLSPKEIFQQTVQSIIRVSDAKAAKMTLLRNTDDPQLRVSEEPVLRVSYGLGMDYDEKVSPRPDGLTVQVLQARRPLAVSHPGQPPGINPLARERGSQANLCLPMMSQDTIIGVFFVYYDKPHSFSKNETTMLSLFTNQAALAIQNKRLLDQLKSQFRYLAHATTIPLTSIGLLIEQLYRQTDPAKAEQAYRIIKMVIAELDTTIKNNLAMSRDAQGLLQPDFRPFNLSQLVADTVDLFSLEAVDKGVSLRKQVGSDAITAWGDPGMITQALHNLVKNALYAFPELPQRQKDKVVEISGQKRANELAVLVRDTGMGIPPEEQTRVFETFYSGSGRTGIGLTISRTIAELHDGNLTVEARAGEGSTFQLTLPYKERSA